MNIGTMSSNRSSLVLVVLLHLTAQLWCYDKAKEPRILLIHWNPVAQLIATPHHKLDQDSLQFLGTSVYKVNLYNHLDFYGAHVWPLIIDDERWYNELTAQGKKAFLCRLRNCKNHALKITEYLKKICTTESINIVHCHTDFETQLALHVSKKCAFKVVRTIHVDNNLGDKSLSAADGLICVGPVTEKKLTLNAPQNITWIAPFFNEKKFLEFTPNRNKESFFKEEFGIDIKPFPIISSVANFYQQYKNHAVLLHAIHILIHQKKIPVQLVLAGLGPRMEEMQRLAKDLRIQDAVYFIGHTKKVPELYFFSDIDALTSNVETFGIALLEGALMKKPLIGTRGTGMEGIIRHGENGLLFDCDDKNSLAEMIATLINNGSYASQLANQAYRDALDNFTSRNTVKKLMNFYNTIISYPKTSPTSQNDKQNLLANTYVAQEKNTYPDEISFCIADLKYDGYKIQICELGEGIESRFKGYDALCEQGEAWVMLWSFLQSFTIPVWFVDQWRSAHHEYMLHDFISMGGHVATTLNALNYDKTFMKASQKNIAPGIRNHAGIVVTRSLGTTALHISRFFINNHRNFLLLGDATNDFVRNKSNTNQLFNTPDLEQYKPRCGIYEKKYHPNLADTIRTDLQSELIVIKPIEASLGDGVIIIPQDQLDQTLRMILGESAIPAHLQVDTSYTHWRTDNSKKFIAEACAHSKAIAVDNQLFDPTMRIFFAIYNDCGRVHINFFGAYWKLPLSPLSSNCPINQKLKSHISTQSKTSVAVNEHDFNHVKELLAQALPKIYVKMLEARTKRNEGLVTKSPRAKMM